MIAAAAALPSMLVNEVKLVGFVILDEHKKDQGHSMQEEKTIGQVIADEGRFSELHELLRDAKGIKEDLEDPKLQLTLFAPLNEAFDQFNHTTRKGYEIQDLLKYHISSEVVVGMGDLHDGLVLSTELKEKGLKGGRQIVRVTRRDDGAYINLMAHVVSEVVAKNGKILAIDRVLVPPPNMLESIVRVPMVLSDLATALFRTSLDKTFQNQMGLTLLAPDNRAWEENMDFEDLFYLFGEEGKSDLIKILKHHAIRKVEYSTRFREEGHVTLKTMNHDEISVEARRTQPSDQQSRKHNEDNKCGFPVPCDLSSNVDVSEDDGNVDNPEGWEYILNNDQGKIIFADAPTSNGVIHMISNVLIPEGLNLPSKRSEL
jgi:uncharacterized surface protein with fasciclin (FAS1) repeats